MELGTNLEIWKKGSGGRMNDKPKISVIVANFNHEKFIEQAVKSILNQTYDNFEIIIVDDASTDNSKDVINDLVKLDSRIVEPIFIEKNTGKWNALNQGIAKRASGQLVTTQDADDASVKQRLELQLLTLQKMKSFHTLCGFHNCGSQEEMERAEQTLIDQNQLTEDLFVPHAEVVKAVFTGHKTPGINHYYTGNFEVHGASALFYRQHWEHGMKFMPGNMGLRCQKAEDSDFNSKLTLLLQRTSIIKLPLYCYRRGTTTNPAYLEEL